MVNFIPFIIGLMILAAVLRQDQVITIFYFLIGIFVLSRWWSKKSLDNLSFERSFINRSFLGQSIPIELNLINKGWLPVVWLHIHESLPISLISPSFYQQVTTIGPHGRLTLHYSLNANKRGYYPIGPIYLTSGDLMGTVKTDQRKGDVAYLTIYPKIVPLTRITLPSKSPFGSLRYKNPIYEDPTRVIGKRDYQVGDSLRRIDWKATATVHRLQVKQYEASIAVETSIFLNLNSDDYDISQRFISSELAIVTAASIANWAIQHKQPVGLVTNGFEPFIENQSPSPLPPRKGSLHLMNVLDILARVQTGKSISFTELINHSMAKLSWGSTIILITGRHDDALFDVLFEARRLGLSAVIILVGEVPGFEQVQTKANRIGFPFLRFVNEADLEAWK